MNELEALVKRCFEAMGYVPGDYTDAAAACVWMETHGLDGISLIADRLSQLRQEAGRTPQVVSASEHLVVVDVKHTNVLVCGQKLTELAYAMTANRGLSRLELRRCESQVAIVPSVAALAKRGCFALAHWQNGASQFCAHTLGEDALPQLTQTESTSPSMEPDVLHITCSTTSHEISVAADAMRTANGRTQYSLDPKSMRQFYDERLEHGLTVDAAIWNTLCTTADAVLIRATEQSRRGAGA